MAKTRAAKSASRAARDLPTEAQAALSTGLAALVAAATSVAADPTAAAETAASDTAVSDTAAADTAASDTAAPAGVASEVMDQLAVVLSAAARGGLSGMDSEHALRVVEAAEVVKSWADSVSVEAAAVMVAEIESDFADLGVDPTAKIWTRYVRSCRSATAREIQVATGLPITACQHRVWLSACEPERVGPVRDAMRLGRLSFTRAVTLTEATADLDAYTAAVIATRVLRPLTGPDGVPLPGTAPLSQATFLARLRTQLVLAHGRAGHAQRSYQQGMQGRDLRAEANRDGTGTLILTGDGARISAAAARVDQIARRLRNNGDPRTLAQLRTDVATDLLLRGWIPDDPTFTQLGKPPAATVNLVVCLATLLGADNGVGQIPGWGALAAEQARRLALTAGSIWTRIVTDPLTGRAIEATAHTYRVPTGMARQVTTRDGTCRAPGCEIPATGTDLDHTHEWHPGGAGGPTTETNLTALHRGHHNLKTTGFWDSEQHPDGTLTWTTATGRTITTYPHQYNHPDNQPLDTSHLESLLGRHLAPIINPDIPLPGHLNIFDEINWRIDLAPATPAPPPRLFPHPITLEIPTNSQIQQAGPPPF